MRTLPFLVLFLCGCSGAAERMDDVPETPKPGAAERLAAPAEAGDWPRFLGPNGDGTSPETGLRTDWNKTGLTKLWDCPLGQGYAPPSTAAGRLFHFDRFGDKARLTARNAVTGELLWTSDYATDYVDSYGYDPGPRCCPVIEDGRVFLHGVEGMVVCLEATTGKELWKVDTRTAYRFKQNFFGVGSTPVVEGDLLIVAVGGSPAGPKPGDFRELKGDGSAIVAFDKKTGVEKYRLSNELASYASPIVATIDGKRVGLYFARGGLLGFDPVAGKELFFQKWRAKSLESVNAANPVVLGNTILIGDCYENGSLSLKWEGGKLTTLWSNANADEKSMPSHWCTPIAVGKFVYGCGGRNPNDADLRCIDAATGAVKWIERRTTRSTLIAADGHLLSLGEQGELRLLKPNPEKYEEIARWEIPGLAYPCWAPPVVSRGILYVRGQDDTKRTAKLLAFRWSK